MPPAFGAFPPPLRGLAGIPTDGGFQTVDPGTHDVRAAAADAIASLITDVELSAECIIPSPFDERVVPAVAQAVAEVAHREGAVATR